MIRNRKGVIGLPIRLAVTFLILSLFVPAAMTMMDDLDEQTKISATKNEAETVCDHIKRAYYAGNGSRSTMDVNVIGSMCLAIGGEGSDAYTVRILSDDTEKEKIYLQRPSVRIIGEPIFVTGNVTLSFSCTEKNGIYGVEVVRIA